jgi:DNA-directed RNA polymerase subunit RPC12/RpoP
MLAFIPRKPYSSLYHYNTMATNKDDRTIGKEYSLMKYKCGYCGKEFKQFVRAVMKDTPGGYKQEIAVSSQVRCPRCKAFLKTWEDGAELIEVTKKKPKKRQYELEEKVK